MMDNMVIANRIKMLREENDLLQQDLADKMREHGVKTTRVAISKWECGKHVPETNSLRVLSEIFGVSMNYLSGLSDKRHGGLIATKDDDADDLYEMPEYDADGNKIEYSDEELAEARLYYDAASLRQTLRENRELRMLLSASQKLNKDDLMQLTRIATLMDKE